VNGEGGTPITYASTRSHITFPQEETHMPNEKKLAKMKAAANRRKLPCECGCCKKGDTRCEEVFAQDISHLTPAQKAKLYEGTMSLGEMVRRGLFP